MRHRRASSGGSEVRVIGGNWRGRKIRFAAHDGLRPTGDRVRETLFNWLGPHLRGSRCLDLFAGSGALGIEALSRGALHCDFIEQDLGAARTLEQNLMALDAVQHASVHKADALEWLAGAREGWDIVFIDPPFSAALGLPSLEALAGRGLLRDGGHVYFETSRSSPEPIPTAHYDTFREKTAGDVLFRLLGLAHRDNHPAS